MLHPISNDTSLFCFYRKKYVILLSSSYLDILKNQVVKKNLKGRKDKTNLIFTTVKELQDIEANGGRDPDLILKNPSESKGGVAQKLIKVKLILMTEDFRV